MKLTGSVALGALVLLAWAWLAPPKSSTPPTRTTSASGRAAQPDTVSESRRPIARHEGFGAATRGALSSPTGFEAYRVTSLADAGPGTLRDALSRGRRSISFDVGGTIRLSRDLNIPFSYITIDGSTAPAPGITILQPGNIGTTLEARPSTGPVHDIVIQHLRMNGLATANTNVGDIWGLDGMAAPVHRVILSHITGIAATDGVFDIYGAVHDVTISWNLIIDTVDALHVSTTDTGQIRQRISVHHNVFARNNERQIRLRHDSRMIDFVNNVVYGWGWHEGGGSGLDIAYDSGEINPSLNVVGNVFHFVEGRRGLRNQAIKFAKGPSTAPVFFSGNLVPAGESDNVSTGERLVIPETARITTDPAGSLLDAVVLLVGTRYPTDDERRLLREIRAALGHAAGSNRASDGIPRSGSIDDVQGK